MSFDHHCLVCQNRTCRKQGSAKVLAALRSLAPESVEVVATGCLGQCGSGPVVLVLPQESWYRGVSPKTAAKILAKLQQDYAHS
ncbi:MAG: (2Fe-2S) ferredoxin domain-containing protein [Elainellaceae cyanobacterium]